MQTHKWLTWAELQCAIRHSLGICPKSCDCDRIRQVPDAGQGFGIIADSDGVLLDYACLGETGGDGQPSLGELVWKAGLRQVLDSLGDLVTRPFDEVLEEVHAVRKQEGAGAWPHIAERMAKLLCDGFDGVEITGEEIFQAVADNARQVIAELPPERVRHYGFVPQFLHQCCAYNIPVVVVTSASSGCVEAEYEHWQVGGCFLSILAAEQTKEAGVPYKPHPAMFQYARSAPQDGDVPGLGLDGEQVTLILEDNLSNLARGVNAVPFSYGIGFARGGRDIAGTKELLLQKIGAEDGLDESLSERIIIIDPAEEGLEPLLDLIRSLDDRGKGENPEHCCRHE